MKNILIMFLAIFVSYGCGSVYKKKDGRTVGYTDKAIGNGIYELIFTGDSFTNKDKVKNYWHRRAKELCGKRKYTGSPVITTRNYSNMAITAGVPYEDKYSLHTATGEVKCTL